MQNDVGMTWLEIHENNTEYLLPLSNIYDGVLASDLALNWTVSSKSMYFTTNPSTHLKRKDDKMKKEKMKRWHQVNGTQTLFSVSVSKI